MNFAPFGVPLTAALPVATQFSAGKITQSVTTPNGQVVGVLQGLYIIVISIIVMKMWSF